MSDLKVNFCSKFDIKFFMHYRCKFWNWKSPHTWLFDINRNGIWRKGNNSIRPTHVSWCVIILSFCFIFFFQTKYGKIIGCYLVKGKEWVLVRRFFPTTRMDCFGSQIFKLNPNDVYFASPKHVTQGAHFSHLCEHAGCQISDGRSHTMIERQRVEKQRQTMKHCLNYPFYRRNRFYLGNKSTEE